MSHAVRADPAADARGSAEGGSPLLSLGSLLQALRRRLARFALIAAGSFGVAVLFSQELIALLAQPLVEAWDRHREALGGPRLHFSGLIEPFWVSVTLAFWLALVLSAPVALHQVWTAVARLRSPRTARWATPFSLASLACFVGGAAFCYFVVMPLGFEFFLSYADQNLATMKSALGVEYQLANPLALKPALYLEPYLAIAIRLLVAFGLVFELPIAIFFLSSVGLVTHRGMWRFNRWAVVLSFALAAVLTPGPDVVSQVALAVPLVVLYNLSIGIAFLVSSRRRRAA